MRKTIKFILEALSGEEKNFTEGGIDRAIFLLSIPMVLEMAGEALFAVVDAFFVSKISAHAVATVGFTETVLTLIYSIAIGLSAAATAVVARRVGENKTEEAAIASVQVLILGIFVAIILGVAGVIFADDILRLMGAEEEVIRTGTTFTRIMMGSNVVILLLFLLNAIFRGAGDASIAMRSLWIANLINIVLDPILIFGVGLIPAMGLEGAAWATVIGRGVGVVYQLWVLFGDKGIVPVRKRHFQLRMDIIYRVVKISLGGTGQFLIASASWIFLMRIVARFGSEVVAGYVIAIRLLIFTILPAWGMSNAASTLVGQNLGAEQPGRAEKSVWRTAFFNMLFLLSVSIVYFVFAPNLIGFFSTEPLVLESGIAALRIISAGYIFFAYGMVIGAAFNGAGDTFTPTLLNFICFWLMEIPLAYFMAVHWGFGLHGVFWAVAISESCLAILCIIVFKRGKWKTVKV